MEKYSTQEDRVRGNLKSVIDAVDSKDTLKLEIVASWLAEAIGLKPGTEFTYDNLINMACDWLDRQENTIH